jgi:anti-sigma factor RsiW
MNRPDHNTYREWLNLDVDGSLPREHRAQLDQHLASCPACRSDKEALLALEGVLKRSRVEARPGFRHQVVSSLPSASWESRSPRTWTFPVAVCLLLAVAAAVLMGGGAAGGPGSSVLSTVAAVAGMFQATLLAGSGLLAATWKGLGLLFEQVIASPVSLGVFGVFVLCLNLLLVSLLRRRRPAAQEAAVSRDRGGSGR